MLSILSLISLRSKILMGMLLSLVPMFAITAITYYSARNATLEHTERIMKLVNNNRAREINAFLDRQQKQFLEWSSHEVFGMAIEFETISELRHHFKSMLEGQHGFNLLVLTDIQGNVLAAMGSEDVKGLSEKSLEKQQIKAITDRVSQLDHYATLIEHGFTNQPKFTSNWTYLLIAKVKDTGNQPNGYLMAYLNWSFLQEKIIALTDDNSANAFPNARVSILDLDSNTTLGHSDPDKIDSPLDLGDALKTWLLNSDGGSIHKAKGSAGTDYVAADALQITTGPFTESNKQDQLNAHVFLTSFVPENDIVADVQHNLRTSIGIGTSGAIVIILIAVFFLADVKGKFNKFLTVFEAMSQGNIKKKLAISGRDEFAHAAMSLNRLVEYLQKVLEVCEGVAVGNYDRTIKKSSSDDMLADAISRMTSTLKEVTFAQKEENWRKTGQAELNDLMSGEQDVDTLARNIITFLAEYLNAQVGAIYLKANDNTLRQKGSYALTRRKDLNNKFDIGEGLVGQAALERKEIIVTNLPEDYLPVRSGTGAAAPSSILVLPFLYENEVKGVIELGAFDAFPEKDIEFLKDAIDSIAIIFNTAQSRNRMAELLVQTQRQTSALQKQQEELRSSNEELEEQTALLKKSEDRLQVQKEELHQSNEELIAKSQILEEQKADIEQKNTKLKKAQQIIEQKAKDLEVSSRYKSEFLANMSHELRTPLNSLLILSEILQKNQDGNLSEKEVNFAGTINGAATDLLNLINEILDLSKIESGKMTLQFESFVLEDLKVEMVNSFEPVAIDKGLAFNVEIDDRVPAILRSDRQRLSQIIKNLLSNALKFTQKGSVSLTIGRPPGNTTFMTQDLSPEHTIGFIVTDTGKGVAKEKQKQIFEAFQQEDGGTNRQYGGTGLGLSISRELAILLGGEIQLHSEEDKGSTFSLYLPDTPPQADVWDQDAELDDQSPEKPIAVRKSAPQAAKKTHCPVLDHLYAAQDDRDNIEADDRVMLIVEDDANFAKILMDLIHKRQFKCLLAGNGESGLYLAENYRPDAVILDIKLPGISGWEVLERLKDNIDTRHIPVYCISVADKTHQAAQMGAIGYLVKPAKMDELIEVLKKIESMLAEKIRHLLVVEDDANQREAIIELIADNGVAIATAESGQQALDQIQSQPFDCMILDLGLPDMTGFDLLKQLKANDAIGFIPTIVFTAKDLSPREETELARYTQHIIVKGSEQAQERLVDETCLFLHQVDKDMSAQKQRMIAKRHSKDSNLENKQILLVDDDMRNIFVLTHVLEDKQMRVVAAKNGIEAMDRLEQHQKIDLVLMDIMMPEMDGYQAIRAIREQKRFAELPIIALTAKAMQNDRQKCIDAGANDYLSKPVDTQRLISMLNVWLHA